MSITWHYGYFYASRSSDRVLPTRIYNSLIPGGILAFMVMIILVFVYFPSTVSTVLKFRSGVLPSLRDPDFGKYRAASDLVC